MRYSLPKFAPDSYKNNREQIYFCDRLNFSKKVINQCFFGIRNEQVVGSSPIFGSLKISGYWFSIF